VSVRYMRPIPAGYGSDIERPPKLVRGRETRRAGTARVQDSQNPSKRLSVVQQTFWLEHRLAPDSAAYNMALPIRIRSAHDVSALTRAVELVGARHELLRSRFVEVDGAAWRVPADEPTARLEISEVAAADLRGAVRAFINRPFDLTAGAFRVVLLRVAPDDAVLLPVSHHIAGDFTSDGDYDLFVEQESRFVASDAGQRSREHWSARIDGVPAAQLPFDRPRPARARHVGATHKVRLAEDVTERLGAAAKDLGVTRFAVLLGAFNALIHRYTGLDDFLVGCPATNRPLPQLAEVVGPFVNALPIRASFHAGTTFREAIGAANEQLRSGLPHAGYPCALLNGGAPLVRLALLLVAMDRVEPALPNPAAGQDAGPAVECGGLTVALMDAPSQEGQLDLVIRLERSAAGIDLVCAYDTDLFDAGTVERFAGHFERFARGALDDPDAAVAELPMTGDADLAELLALGGVWSE
jgi:hypothetical protein